MSMVSNVAYVCRGRVTFHYKVTEFILGYIMQIHMEGIQQIYVPIN